jgi:hypothetical protein
MIPHTTDVDIAMSIDEYDDKIKQKFLGNPLMYLRLALGKRKSSLEFRFVGCDYNYDLFFLYKVGPNKYCNFYHATQIAP